ncbi:hypothetical protein Salat_0860500 [Sesamum alatum]|uniref:Zinc knuckle CX2CX4HX4C domain-containing protein n=1 Tax=Sesamum alatum TaxID=300844 RepID=A0AAE2CQP2_9LAMI|nr:hypothetical protein Salat_0860500 [Sesamum alatum]
MAREVVLTRLNRSLQLTEDEADGEDLLSHVWSRNVDDKGHYLVGRLLALKPARFAFLKEMLQNIINPIKGIDFQAIEDGRNLFRLNHVIYKKRALDGCPWNFEKNILILNEVNEDEHPMGNGSFHGTWDIWTNHRQWSSTLRIRVKIKVNKPLLRFMKIKYEVGDSLTVAFMYERLLNFYYICDNTPYGPWLRASPILQAANRPQSTSTGFSYPGKEGGTKSGNSSSSTAFRLSQRSLNIFNPIPNKKSLSLKSSSTSPFAVDFCHRHSLPPFTAASPFAATSLPTLVLLYPKKESGV